MQNMYNAYFVAYAPKKFETFSYYWGEEKKFLCYITTKRRNGIEDIIPLVVSKNMKNKLSNIKKKVEFYGRICTKSVLQEDGKRHLKVFVMVEKICQADDDACDRNSIYIQNAYVCKKQIMDRKVDIIIATNYKLNPSAYIPVVARNDNAVKISHIPIGSEIKITARFQSREYVKRDVKKITFELFLISIG